VFLLDKAETAVETRQLFVDALRRAGAFSGSRSRRENRSASNRQRPRRNGRFCCTSCSRSPKTPATFSNRLVL